MWWRRHIIFLVALPFRAQRFVHYPPSSSPAKCSVCITSVATTYSYHPPACPYKLCFRGKICEYPWLATDVRLKADPSSHDR